MNVLILAMTSITIVAWLSYLNSKIRKNHEDHRDMYQELSREIIEESSDVKKKINNLFELIDEIREDIKRSSAIKETLNVEKPKTLHGTYIRNEEQRKKLSDTRKAWWAEKKAKELKESAPVNEPIPRSQAFVPFD